MKEGIQWVKGWSLTAKLLLLVFGLPFFVLPFLLIALGEETPPPAPSSNVQGTDIKLDGSSEKITETEIVPYSVERQVDDSLAPGEEVVLQKGQAGEKTIIYEVIKVDNFEVSRQKVEEKISKPPINEIIGVGP